MLSACGLFDHFLPELFERRSFGIQFEGNCSPPRQCKYVTRYQFLDCFTIEVERHALPTATTMTCRGIVGIATIGEADVRAVALPLTRNDRTIARIPKECSATASKIFNLSAVLAIVHQLCGIAELLGCSRGR